MKLIEGLRAFFKRKNKQFVPEVETVICPKQETKERTNRFFVPSIGSVCRFDNNLFIVAELSPAGEIYDDDILIIKTSHLIEFFPDYYSPTYGARFIIGARMRQYLRAADNNERRFLYDFIEKHAQMEK